jgi:hypothetical protein
VLAQLAGPIGQNFSDAAHANPIDAARVDATGALYEEARTVARCIVAICTVARCIVARCIVACCVVPRRMLRACLLQLARGRRHDAGCTLRIAGCMVRVT